MFSGEVLPGGGAARWVEPYRARLEETRLELIEEQLAGRLERGAAGEVVAELQSLVADHPLREGLWTLLITALYRADRQADALAAYRRVQHLLADELGLDPGPELQVLERQVLRQDPELAFSPDRRPDNRCAGNLGGLSGSLLGRAADLAAVGELVAAHRLVTLVGLAGVGKTRLAIEVARDSRRRTAVGWCAWRMPGPRHRSGRAWARCSTWPGPPRRWCSIGCAGWTCSWCSTTASSWSTCCRTCCSGC